MFITPFSAFARVLRKIYNIFRFTIIMHAFFVRRTKIASHTLKLLEQFFGKFQIVNMNRKNYDPTIDIILYEYVIIESAIRMCIEKRKMVEYNGGKGEQIP